MFAAHGSTGQNRFMSKTTRQYGRWSSPLTPATVAAGRRIDGVAFDSDGTTLVWLEGRSGQGVLVVDDGNGDAPRDLTAQHSVRAEVGYGGGDFTCLLYTSPSPRD